MPTRQCPACGKARAHTEFTIETWREWIAQWINHAPKPREGFTLVQLMAGLGVPDDRFQASKNHAASALKLIGFAKRQQQHGGIRTMHWYRMRDPAPATEAIDLACYECRKQNTSRAMGSRVADAPAVELNDAVRTFVANTPTGNAWDVPTPSGYGDDGEGCASPSEWNADHVKTFEPAPAPEPHIEVVRETVTQVEEHRLKTKVRDLESEIRGLVSDLSDAQTMLDLKREVDAAEKPEPITPREKGPGSKREATALVLASDWHIEEEVKPEAVAHRNRYNLEISAQRMTRFFEATRWALDNNRHAFTIRDMVLWLGGDIITNYLHDDNIETNLLSPVQAIAYAQVNITAGIKFLLEDPGLERLVIPCNDGNHGRLTEKMRAASRIENSLEWLLYRNLQSEFANEPRVQFILPEGAHTYYEVYGRTIRFLHGDTVKYGGGVGGITIPINKALARFQSVRRADLTCMGHFHQLTSLRDLIINGSLVGYSSYALTIGAMFEEPAQSFSILDPHRFKGIHVPLWVGSREDDIMTRGAA